MIPEFSRYEGEKIVSYKSIGLALLEQCKANGLTAGQALFVLDELKNKIERESKNSAI